MYMGNATNLFSPSHSSTIRPKRLVTKTNQKWQWWWWPAKCNLGQRQWNRIHCAVYSTSSAGVSKISIHTEHAIYPVSPRWLMLSLWQKEKKNNLSYEWECKAYCSIVLMMHINDAYHIRMLFSAYIQCHFACTDWKGCKCWSGLWSASPLANLPWSCPGVSDEWRHLSLQSVTWS